MKMKLIKNIKYLQQNFHERYMYPKLQPILHRGTARVTSLLHVNSLWLCILCRFVIGAAGQKPIFSAPEPKAQVHYCDHALSVVRRPSSVRLSSLTFHIFDFSSETTKRNLTKLYRKVDLNVLYQVCVFRADRKNKMAALASDWLRHFRLLL